jgi:proteasome lid subunit RPN8/RPN11
MTPKLLELPRAGPLRVQITEDLLRELWQAATHNPNVEVGGFVLGHVYPLGHSDYHLVLTRYLPVEDTKATEREFTFRAEAFVKLDHAYPIARGQTPTGLTCLGWFHTHPGHGVFFSAPDQAVHHGKFSANTFQIGLVVDPQQQRAGLFFWQAPGTLGPTQMGAIQTLFDPCRLLAGAQDAGASQAVRRAGEATGTRVVSPGRWGERRRLFGWLGGCLSVGLILAGGWMAWGKLLGEPLADLQVLRLDTDYQRVRVRLPGITESSVSVVLNHPEDGWPAQFSFPVPTYPDAGGISFDVPVADVRNKQNARPDSRRPLRVWARVEQSARLHVGVLPRIAATLDVPAGCVAIPRGQFAAGLDSFLIHRPGDDATQDYTVVVMK